MAIKMTEKAATEVTKIMKEQNYPDDTMLRFGIEGGGCSGFSYRLTFDSKYDENVDELHDLHGVKVVIDRKSGIYVADTTIDFYDGIDKRGFFFENPKAVKTCGCGTSFSV